VQRRIGQLSGAAGVLWARIKLPNCAADCPPQSVLCTGPLHWPTALATARRPTTSSGRILIAPTDPLRAPLDRGRPSEPLGTTGRLGRSGRVGQLRLAARWPAGRKLWNARRSIGEGNYLKLLSY